MGNIKKRNSIQAVGLMMIVWTTLGSVAAFGAIQVEVGEAPNSNLALTLRAIKSARKTLQVNAYEFTSPVIGEAIRERIRAGVKVDILQEGEPVGGFPEEGEPIRRALVNAIRAAEKGSYRLMVGRSTGVRRFPFDHAKYMIVDKVSVLTGSENYSPTGHPAPGNKGNRGWEVLIHDESFATDYRTVFSGDRHKNRRDIEEWVGFAEGIDGAYMAVSQVGRFFFTNTSGLAPEAESLDGEYARDLHAAALPAARLTPIIAPDISLNSLIQLIRSARRTVDVQQMIFNPDWDEQMNASPLLAELIAASRRGVRVRVLLNDDEAFRREGNPIEAGGAEESKNLRSVNFLNDVARRFRLNLEARIANVDAMGVGYIHNKGMLIDGTQTLVSSINWNQNSITRNRESGVLIASPQIHQFYGRLFESDWRVSR